MLKIITEARIKKDEAAAFQKELDDLKALGVVEASEMPFSAYDSTDTETIQLQFPNIFKAFCSFTHEQLGIPKNDLDQMDEEWDTLTMPGRKEIWPSFIEYVELMISQAGKKGPQGDKIYKKYYKSPIGEE